MKWFLLLLVIVLAGCSQQADCSTGCCGEECDEPFFAHYEGGVLTYKATVTKPNPCYGVESDVIMLESFPVQIRLDISLVPPPSDMVCAQVLTNELIKESIVLDSAPGSFNVVFEGNTLFSKEDFR